MDELVKDIIQLLREQVQRNNYLVDMLLRSNALQIGLPHTDNQLIPIPTNHTPIGKMPWSAMKAELEHRHSIDWDKVVAEADNADKIA